MKKLLPALILGLLMGSSARAVTPTLPLLYYQVNNPANGDLVNMDFGVDSNGTWNIVFQTGTSLTDEAYILTLPQFNNSGYSGSAPTVAFGNTISIAATVASSYGANLGTFAAPNTAAGSLAWTAPVLSVWTSASAALRTYTLPAASAYAGQGLILYVAVGTNHVNLQPATGAQLNLAGTLLTANHYIQCASSSPGNYICLISDGTNWSTLGQSGSWADSATP